MRKTARLEVTDRIRIWFQSKDEQLTEAARCHVEYISIETLATAVQFSDLPEHALLMQEFDVNGASMTIVIERI